MGVYSTHTVRVPVPGQYPVRVRLAKWSTRALEPLILNDITKDGFMFYLMMRLETDFIFLVI